MADQTDIPTHYYYLNFRARGCWYIARLNGVTFSSRYKPVMADFILPFNHYLKSGENVLELIYVPVWQEGDTKWAPGTPNPEFGMRATLRKRNLTTQEEQQFGLANVQFDMETGELVTPEKTDLGQTLLSGWPEFGRVGPMEETEGLYSDVYGPPVEARVLKIRFTIPDVLPPFPWADAKVMTDTPELRTRLAAAYSDVHKAIEASDFQRVFELYEPAWSRFSVAMAYKDAREYVEVNEAEKSLARDNGRGGILAPLKFEPNLKDVRLEIMADGKLARFDPAPVYWGPAQEPSQRASSTMVSFYLDQNDELKMGQVLYAF